VGSILEPLRMADDWENSEIIYRTLAKRANVSVKRLERLIREMAANWESLETSHDPKITPEERARFLGAWNEHRRIYGYTLPAELPYALRAAIRDHPDLDGIDFDILIVDEYQDLNACDLEVLKMIGQKGASIVAVGDDDQSVYSFRKAAPEGIRRFLSDYPGAVDYPLSIAQRCGRKILGWATSVIDGDPDRPGDRPGLSCADTAPEGRVAFLSFKGQASEAKGIAGLARRLIEKESMPPSEILILLRSDYNGTFSKPVKLELERLGIPYSDPDSVDRILEEPNNRRSLALFYLLVNRLDPIAWATLLEKTPGIGETFTDAIYEKALSESKTFSQALVQAYEAGFPDLPKAPGRKAQALLKSVIEWIDSHPIPGDRKGEWGQWIIDNCREEDGLAISSAFKEILIRLDDLIETQQTLDRFLGQITPLSKDIALAHSEGIRIMSLRKAKGLTVRAAIIGAVEEGIVPRPECRLGEERRLLYVGMTRAREFLFCTWARRRRGPTARSGLPRVGIRRSHSTFLTGGPIESQDGETFLTDWV